MTRNPRKVKIYKNNQSLNASTVVRKKSLKNVKNHIRAHARKILKDLHVSGVQSDSKVLLNQLITRMHVQKGTVEAILDQILIL